ncbi:MAG TPA: hypothetical protein P5309_02395 [Syntrophomonadaceae bacterium]|nr:hypothetical protein [Syntrophomonadaceae bacterium]
MKKYVLITAAIVILAGAGLYLASMGKADRVQQIPEVFHDLGIGWVTNDGITLLQTRQGASIYPVIHDDQALYILSGNADRISKYYVDKVRQEIVVEQDMVKPQSERKAPFQVVTIPAAKYESIIKDGMVTVRVQFNYLDKQSIYVQYDTSTKTSKLVDGAALTQ